MKYFQAICGAAIAGLTGVRLYAQVVAGATSQEEHEARVAEGLMEGKSTSDLLKIYQDLLAKSPESRFLRLSYARLLLEIGRPADAGKELTVLSQKSLELTGVRSLRIEWARQIGDKPEELAYYEEWARQPLDADPSIAIFQLAPKGLEAHIQELKGNLDLAEAAWRDYLRGKRLGMSYYRELADFYLRNGRYREAIDTYQILLDNNVSRIDDGFYAVARFDQVVALWGMGNESDAALRTMALLTSPERLPKEGRDVDNSFVAPALAAITFTRLPHQVLAERDRAQAEAALQSLSVSLDVNGLYRYDIILAALSGKLPMRDAADRLTKILRDSPYLDWALWSDVYLAFRWPAELKRVLNELPKETIQHRIVENRIAQDTEPSGPTSRKQP